LPQDEVLSAEPLAVKVGGGPPMQVQYTPGWKKSTHLSAACDPTPNTGLLAALVIGETKLAVFDDRNSVSSGSTHFLYCKR
jgi:hypothetical protein